MKKHIQQLRKGSTTILILSLLQEEAKYGYQIMRELEAQSDGYFTMTAALLYPALHHLEDEGFVQSEWRDGQGKRQRKYYVITEAGRNALKEQTAEWHTFVNNLFKTLEPKTGGT